MSLSPDDIPEGLLTIPLDELTDVDLDAMRRLRDCAVRGDWKGAFEILTNHKPTKAQEPKP